MKKLTNQQIANLKPLTTEQLQAWFDNVGNNPANRVKGGRNKGQLKMSVIKDSDIVLSEIHRRKNIYVQCIAHNLAIR